MFTQRLISLSFLPFLAVSFGACRMNANFHEIDPGKYYRSAQLHPDELQKAIDHFQIRTVINLRGEAPEEKWFQEERRVPPRGGTIEGRKALEVSAAKYRLSHTQRVLDIVEREAARQ